MTSFNPQFYPPSDKPVIPPSYEVAGNSDLHFQAKLGSDRIINIFLHIIRFSEDEWSVEAKTTLESAVLKDKTIKEVKNTLHLEGGDSKWLGSWDCMNLKPACVNLNGIYDLFEEEISKPDNITRQELGNLHDEILIRIVEYPNVMDISSAYLTEMTGKPRLMYADVNKAKETQEKAKENENYFESKENENIDKSS
jgi:hypothetical protein